MDATSREKETLVYVPRANTDSLKWDALETYFGQEELMPLWVADMDFKAPAAVRKALGDWVEHGAYGYYRVPEGYLDAFIRWESQRHGYQPQREHIHFLPGVVPAIYWLLYAASQPGDGVLLLTPVYYPFFDAVRDTGRKLVRSELVNTGGQYTIDFEDVERKIVEEEVKVFILCSPHNPVGRVWQREELERLLDICARHGVHVVADEIHHDLVLGQNRHIPAACINPQVTTVTSASKTFNLAGLQNSFVILPEDGVRDRFEQQCKAWSLHAGGNAGYIAARAAYEQGGPWLEALLDQLRQNEQDLRSIMTQGLPRAVISPLEGTYLAWIDLSAYLKDKTAKEVVQEQCRLAVDFGDWFGGAQYERFIRINLATRNENIREAAERLVSALQAYDA